MQKEQMKCCDCIYYDCLEHCRRRPPVLIKRGGEVFTLFPKVTEGDWCGEGEWFQEGEIRRWCEWVHATDPLAPPEQECEL
jgi:hypothetical protein